jgi:hypothetical protein
MSNIFQYLAFDETSSGTSTNYADGCAIKQKVGRGEVVVLYDSFCFTPTERRYPTFKKELCAIVRFLVKWHCYLGGLQTTISNSPSRVDIWSLCVSQIIYGKFVVGLVVLFVAAVILVMVLRSWLEDPFSVRFKHYEVRNFRWKGYYP